MPATDESALNRTFTPKELTRGAGLRAWLWSLAAAIALSITLLFALQLLEAVRYGGIVRLTASETSELNQLVDISPLPLDSANRLAVRDTGLLPVVWSQRETISGNIATWLYTNFTLFDTDRSTLIVLLGICAIGLAATVLLLERNQANVLQLTNEIQARMRRMLHRQTLRLGQSDLKGELVSRAGTLFGRETDALGAAIESILTVWTRSVPLIMILFFLGLAIDWLTYLQVLMPLEAAWLIWRYYDRRYSESERRAAQRAESDLRQLTSGFGIARVVRGYGMEEFEQQRFQALIDDYHLQRRRALAAGRRLRGLGAVLALVALAAVSYLLLAKIHAANGFGYPTAIVLVLDVVAISLAVRSLEALPRSQAVASSSASAIFAFLNRPPEIGQAVGAKFVPPVSRSVYFESVTYRNGDGAPLLQNLDLKIKAGEKLVVVSLDPLPARALAWMLPRFIEPQSGRVLFDGEDIAWGTLESLRAETILVSASDPLLTGTILENLTGGSKEYSLQDATEAAKLAHAHSFIAKLPHGYETRLGPDSTQLGVGQLFRLSLARALLRKPAFLIIEEPTNGLDADTKSLLDDVYQRMFADRTVLILPGRLSTVKKADRVIVLHQGRVESVGTHASLVKSCNLYRHWEYVHFNEFRAAATEAT